MLVFPSALKLYKIHNKGPIICQLNVEFEDFQPVKFCENSNLRQCFKKASYLQQKVFNSVCDKIVLFHFYIYISIYFKYEFKKVLNGAWDENWDAVGDARLVL